jgi:hypothetical protein
MTTVHLATPGPRCRRHQVCGVYEGPDDRYVFGVREFDDATAALRYAEDLADRTGGVIERGSN